MRSDIVSFDFLHTTWTRMYSSPLPTCWVLLVQIWPTPYMSQHDATWWPNARSMLRPTMLRYVALTCCDRLAGALIAGFHMTSLKFELQNYWSSWDFTLMMYKSSWELIFIQIFAPNAFLVWWYTTLKFLSFLRDAAPTWRPGELSWRGA